MINFSDNENTEQDTKEEYDYANEAPIEEVKEEYNEEDEIEYCD